MQGLDLDRLKLAIGASFTADLLGEFAPFWSRTLSVGVDFSLTPSATLLQSLLRPASAQNEDAAAVRSLLIRWSDFGDDPAAAAKHLVAAVNASGLRYSIFICPDQRQHPRAPDINDMRAALDPRGQIVDAAEIFAKYDVDNPFDTHTDHTASVPYSHEAFAALSAELVRRACAARRAPIKLVAVDCDNTIWRGVVGEDGAAGIQIDRAAAALQRRLCALSDAGVAIALLSKNKDADVVSVFKGRPEMALSLDHISVRGVNWRDKSENLKAIAERFAVAQDAIVFLDDNPVEIAAMRAQAPGAVSVIAASHARFADHLWVLDGAPTTREDRARRQMVREDAARRDEAKAAPTLKAFIDGLDLRVDISTAGAGAIARLAQLTQRTNQFNTALLRFCEHELAAWVAKDGRQLFSVSARDRFGDYGVVGVIALERQDTRHTVALFSLSCRALGRGVEHQMAAYVGDYVTRMTGGDVAFALTHGPRNEPAVRFLNEILGREAQAGANVVNAKKLAALRYDPGAQLAIQPTQRRSAQPVSATGEPDWAHIAEKLTTGRAIMAAAAAARQSVRRLPSAYIAPAGGLESDIAKIWEDVLAVSPVGAQDAFTALGGKSIELVQIHARLIRLLRRPIELTSLFECSTPAQLARRLGEALPETPQTIRTRANAMANARAGRMKRTRQTLETI